MVVVSRKCQGKMKETETDVDGKIRGLGQAARTVEAATRVK